MIKQDYILRLVEELGRAVAKALQSRSTEDLTAVESELDQAEQALGILRGADALDARSLARLLGGDKCVLYSQILLSRAALLEQRQSAHAWALRRRARELLENSRPQALVELKQQLLRQAR